jgi:hypothetical protein
MGVGLWEVIESLSKFHPKMKVFEPTVFGEFYDQGDAKWIVIVSAARGLAALRVFLVVSVTIN